MSGSQKFVLVVSILNIIGAFGIIVFGFTAGLVSFGAAEGGPILFIAGLCLVAMGIFECISGIIGIRAARDPRRSGLFYTLSLISMIFAILNMITSIASNGFQLSSIIGVVLPVLMFISARKIREQGRM
jgi:amino acid permease